MARGTDTIEITTPVLGFRGDLPAHKLDPAMLAAGSYNVVCDPTSILRQRNGYTIVPGGRGPQRPVTGGISWVGSGNTVYTIVADNLGWWQYVAGSTSPWVPLAGSAPVGPDDFTQFAAFATLGVDNLWGVNNNTGSGLVRWTAGTNSINTVAGTPFTSALDCFVLANRLVVVGLVEGGVLYPHRVRWSAFNDPTTWPANALNDVGDPGGAIVAATRQGALQAILYVAGSEWTGSIQTMIAQAGDDANAFSFQEFALGEGVVPPVSTAAVVPVNGIQYYLGVDGHIWMFDSIAPQNFGIAVQSDIMANANFAALNHSFGVYVPGDRHLRFYFPSGFPYANRCVYYSFDFQRWEAPAAYNQRFRSGFTGPYQSKSQLAAFTGGVDGGLFQVDKGLTDNGTPIQFNATWGVRNIDPLSEMQVQFADMFLKNTGVADEIALTVTGLRNPLDDDTIGVVYMLDLSRTSRMQQLTAPGLLLSGTRLYQWIQPSLQGVTTEGMACLGGYIHVNIQRKGVYNVSGRGPE